MNRELANQRFILSTRPTLWLPLYRKGGDTFLSSDGYGHLATVTGATWGIQGRTFGGADQINLGDNLDIGTSDFSVIVTAKTNTDDRVLINKVNGSGTNPGYWVLLSTGRIRLTIYDAVAGATVRSVETVTDNLWHTWAFTVDRDQAAGMRGIIDGTEVTYNLQQDPSAIGTCNNARNLYLGCSDTAGTLGNYFVGTMGEVIMYKDKILSLGEVRNITNAIKWRYQ